MGKMPMPHPPMKPTLPEISHALADATAHAAALARENAELSSVLGAMREGVIALGPGERVTRVNPAAAAFLGTTAEAARGRLLGEVLRHAEAARVARAALDGREESGEAELLVSAPATGRYGTTIDKRVFQIHGAPLPGRNGAVLVLHDVTDLRRLEVIRQDFVANASHEIRTPTAAIQAAIETLADAPDMGQADRDRFMGMLSRQSLRLSAIVEDLLTLSRLERGTTLDRAKLEEHPLAPVLEAAAEACAPRAAAAKVLVEVSCEDSLSLPCDPVMLERAIVNLMENAIKYGASGGRVEVAARHEGGHMAISVRDFGHGIPTEHLSRIFERFYRTDKARSREQGGTGLGLSIVKHIAEGHGGVVKVESAVDAGSTFSLHLPIK